MEIAQEVCNRNHWKMVKKPIVWNQKLDEINSEKIDCVWSGFTINGRENNYTLTRPYFNNSQVVIVKSDSGINYTSDLSGKIVEVLNGSSADVFLKNNMTRLSDSFYMLISMMSFRKDFDDLESGVADAVVMDRIVAIYMINEYGFDKYKILDDEICSEQLGIAFKKGNTDLRDRVQKTLDEMFADGTVKRIAEKYKDYGIAKNLIYP